MNLFLAFLAVANAASTFKVKYGKKKFSSYVPSVLACFRLQGIDFYFWPFIIFDENYFQGRTEDREDFKNTKTLRLKDLLCSVAAYYNLAKENSDYPNCMCGRHVWQTLWLRGFKLQMLRSRKFRFCQ